MIWLKTLIFTLISPGTVAVYLPYWLLQKTGAHCVWQSWRGAIGIVLICVGVIIYGWTAWDFTFAGRGTPAPIDPPKEMVARGLYRYSRNPMYIGMLTVLLGEALLFRSWQMLAYAALMAAIFHSFVVFYEERTLQRRFGDSYITYRQSVPRWLWR